MVLPCIGSQDRPRSPSREPRRGSAPGVCPRPFSARSGRSRQPAGALSGFRTRSVAAARRASGSGRIEAERILDAAQIVDVRAAGWRVRSARHSIWPEVACNRPVRESTRVSAARSPAAAPRARCRNRSGAVRDMLGIESDRPHEAERFGDMVGSFCVAFRLRLF